MSPPAEKPRPSPVTTSTRTASSDAILPSASRISSRIGPPNALSLSGRLSVIVAMGPSLVKMIASYMALAFLRGCALSGLRYSRLTAWRVRDLHLLELLVLNLYRKIQDGFDSVLRKLLQLRRDRVFFENGAAQMHVPLLVGLYLLAIETGRRVIARGFAELDELLVLF